MESKNLNLDPCILIFPVLGTTQCIFDNFGVNFDLHSFLTNIYLAVCDTFLHFIRIFENIYLRL